MHLEINNPEMILAFEKAQAGGCYGGDEFERGADECPVCGAMYPGYYYMNDDEECVGCEMCVTRVAELY